MTERALRAQNENGWISQLLPTAQGLMSTTTARPSRICQLVDNHKAIDRLISSYPCCPRHISCRVDVLLVEAEAIRDFYLNP